MKYIVLFFIYVHYSFNKIGIRIKGLGFAQKALNKKFTFKFLDKKMLFLPTLSCYNYLLIGKPNEPETHIFLSKIFSNLDQANFIDVGANVGEFVIRASIYPSVTSIFAFEPRKKCIEAIRESGRMNKTESLFIYENVVTDNEGNIQFHEFTSGVASSIYPMEDKYIEFESYYVKSVTLDKILPERLINPVILIDVEGAELLVIKGASEFIKKNRPLIIFEFNEVSRSFFTIDDIISTIGNGYLVFRLKSDGSLDQNLNRTSNCVAIHKNTIFAEKVILAH